MKIIYLKKEVSIGELIDFKGLKVVITQELIDSNKELFEVEEDIPVYVERIGPDTRLAWSNGRQGEIFKVLKCSYVNAENCVYSIDFGGANTLGHYINSEHCKISSKEAFDKQELLKKAKRDYPIGTRFDQRTAYDGLGCSHTVIKGIIRLDDINDINISIDGYGVYNSSQGVWAKILKPLHKAEDGVNLYENDLCWCVYQDLQIVKGMIPFSPKLDVKYFSTKKAAQKYIVHNMKALKSYEDLLLGSDNARATLVGVVYVRSMFTYLYEYEPRLYWLKVKSLIDKSTAINKVQLLQEVNHKIETSII